MKRSSIAGDAGASIRSLTEGIFGTAIDISLWLAAYTGAMSMPQSGVGQLWRAQMAADRFLSKVNYETIKRGFAESRRRGFLKTGKHRRRSWPEITQAGKRRLASLLPVYDEKRVWDGRMYMVTYDIPEKLRRKRDLLRDFTRRIGCAKLQDSVYMTPYDPRETLTTFIQKSKLPGTILVADIGTNGSIGDEDLPALVARVYHLNHLNDRYEEWIKYARRHGVDHQAVIEYYAILQDDPQLPFALLRPWWKGDEAYCLVKPQMQMLLK